MKAVISFLKKKSLIEFAGVVALCGLIWVAGPRLDYPKDAILEPEINRVFAILAVVLVWIAVVLFRKVRANRKDQQLVTDLVNPTIDSGQTAMGEVQEAEAAIVREKFAKALTFLRKNLSKGRFDRQYLYQLPLYVIIGAPGCGKTTLLLNSGIKIGRAHV